MNDLNYIMTREQHAQLKRNAVTFTIREVMTNKQERDIPWNDRHWTWKFTTAGTAPDLAVTTYISIHEEKLYSHRPHRPINSVEVRTFLLTKQQVDDIENIMKNPHIAARYMKTILAHTNPHTANDEFFNALNLGKIL